MFRVMDQEVERLVPLRTGSAVTQLQRDDDEIYGIVITTKINLSD